MVDTLRKNLFLLTWGLLVVVALATRVPLPIDETRYLSVAWEMWQRGNLLVPYLNGEPYSHKPPLLFWLIQAGWAVFGVNAWWPRLVVLLIALAAYASLRSLARQLWPEDRQLPELACLLLGGAVLWTLFSALIMFDLLLALWVLIGMTGLAQALAGNRRGWWLVGVMLGLAILTKGPVALLHLLLPALLAPAWSEAARGNLRQWYADAARALLIGAAIALAWALPAAYSGGDAYREALLWKQTAGRVVSSFAHRRPWWSYGLFLPLSLLPWMLWRPAWRALRASLQPLDGGARFCVAWILPVVLSLSLVSGKQPQYLLPVLPPAILLVVRGLALSHDMTSRPAMFAAVLPYGIIAALLAAGPLLPGDWHQGWLTAVSPAWGVAALAVVACAMRPPRLTLLEAARRLHVVAVLVPTLLSAAVLSSESGRSFDVAPAARAVRQMQDRGGVVAYWGDYHGQLNFVGRLTHPLPELRDDAALPRLVATTPGARVLVFSRKEPRLVSGVPPEAVFRYRRHYLSLWPAQQLLAQPGLLERLAGSARPPTPVDDLR